MYIALKLALGSVVVGAASRILNLWSKLSRRWESEARDWDNIT
jgi:hypothetical protein|tara:strand:+ start:1116 stop:1244 length:129 start_codon:yes stop_codon:yes gene_type:complete